MIVSEAPLLISEPAPAVELDGDEFAHLLGIALIPASRCLEILLPRMPAGRRDLSRMLADHAPLLPRHLVWTNPVALPSGTARITVVRRDWLDRYVGGLERERGCMLEARTQHDRLSFLYASPATRRTRHVTMGAWLVSLVISAGILVALPSRGGPSDRLTTTRTDEVVADPAFFRVGVLETIAGQPFANLPAEWLKGVAVERDGSLRVELNAPDPDILRDTVVEQSLLSGYREFGQQRDSAGNYRVTYGLEPGSSPLAINRGTAQIAVLSARNIGEAIAQAEQALIAYTAQQGLQLGLLSSVPEGAGSLELTIELVGPQDNVLAAVQMIESGRPPMRFVEWEFTPDPAGTRLAAILTVPWAQPK
ncbi:hypothetical protein A9995_04455 [Erythrobacter sp. QSSC1-22B]|uniref:hypothetical protein n=1 Tax=Erythrobacter sp. QSSC1-22B TaxID=1860125 RepID=UPI0008048030|nr:hypothetical protein [Erythrobacter sp. QSSC1-22B]OBX19816.1 hypothetical protein A9995_04455 [Erythrobacter sp. QSSC1-22B]